MPLVDLIADSDILCASAAIKVVDEFIGAPTFDPFIRVLGNGVILLLVVATALRFLTNY